MQINLENKDLHSIRAYTDTSITINETVYHKSLIISSQDILSPWAIHTLQELDLTQLAPILTQKPEIILIGHAQQGARLPISVMQDLSQQRIGIECMSIGAACRTFNVLLSEQREVVLGIIF